MIVWFRLVLLKLQFLREIEIIIILWSNIFFWTSISNNIFFYTYGNSLITSAKLPLSIISVKLTFHYINQTHFLHFISQTKQAFFLKQFHLIGILLQTKKQYFINYAITYIFQRKSFRNNKFILYNNYNEKSN